MAHLSGRRRSSACGSSHRMARAISVTSSVDCGCRLGGHRTIFLAAQTIGSTSSGDMRGRLLHGGMLIRPMNRYGSSTTDAVKAARSSLSALARKRTLLQGICLDRVPSAAATAALTLSARLSKFIGTATQYLAAGAKERELSSDCDGSTPVRWRVCVQYDLRTARRVWRMVVLATHTPLTRVL